jgi:hypothetical protein
MSGLRLYSLLLLVLHFDAHSAEEVQRGGTLETLGRLAEQVVNFAVRQQAPITQCPKQGHGYGERGRYGGGVVGIRRPNRTERSSDDIV